MSRRGLVLFLALSTIWGLPYLMIRVAVREVDPGHARLPAHRARRAALGPDRLARRARSGPLSARWRWLVVYTVVEFGVPWLLDVERRTAPDELGHRDARRARCRSSPRSSRSVHAPRRAVRPRAAARGSRSAPLGVGLLVGFDVGGSNWVWIAAMGGRRHRLHDRPRHHLAAPPGRAGHRRRRLRRWRSWPLAYAPFGVTHLPAHVTWSVVGAIAVLALRLHGRGASSSSSS